MKKSVFVFIAVLFSLAACQMEQTDSMSEEFLSAKIEQEEATRTTLSESNNVLWSENDQIIAFMKSSYGHKYQIKPSYAGKTHADFSKVSSASSDDLSAGIEWDHNVAFYPYSESVKCVKSDDDYSLDVTLPSEQTYVSESFANNSWPMVAVSSDNSITFKNVCGGIKLQLKGTQKVTSIKIEGNNNEKLSGTATVTAYTDDTKPAITMASGASTSVTLNCGTGVQLNESTATEFIAAIPPVLFSKGFTITVTDSDSQTYTVETDKANTILRSSLLVMPEVKLGETQEEDSKQGLVETIFIDHTSLRMAPNTSYTFETDVDPFDASDKTLTWSSSAPSIAKVNQDGTITALSDGSAVISAVAVGGASASCAVRVVSCSTPTSDYIDEYGVNHGKGTAIGDIVWAPVNCGYKAATTDSKGFPYGKLYQWGRKYGQGYDSNDEAYPSGDNFVEGPAMPSVVQIEENSDKFYYNTESPFDWSQVQNDDMWNSDTESFPEKTIYDPCPAGWRVPTYAELDKLRNNHSFWTTADMHNGYYFSGDYTYIDDAPQVLFPAPGSRGYDNAVAYGRGEYGYYWSSRPNYDYSLAYGFRFSSSFIEMNHFARASGLSVRCVQE